MRPALRTRPQRLAGWLALAALAGATAGPAAQRPTSRSGTAAVSGRVIDAMTSRPVEGALVELREPRRSQPADGRAVLTNEGGRFRLTSATSGRFAISVTRTGYLDGGAGQQRPAGRLPSFELSAGATLDDVAIRLWPSASVSGRVTDGTGAPLAGVSVRAMPPDTSGAEDARRRFRAATTDDLGEYELTDLPPGDYWIVVPVSHVTWAVNVRRGFMAPPSAVTDATPRTSPDGRFTWTPTITAGAPPLPDGREAVFVTTGYPSATDPSGYTDLRLDPGSERRGIDIVMATMPRVRVRGMSIGADGPLDKVTLRLHQAGMQVLDVLVQASGHADGRFEFLSLPPGTYELNAFRTLGESDVIRPDPEGYWAQETLTIGDQDIDDLTVRLTRGHTVRARIELGDLEAPRIPPVRLMRTAGDNTMAVSGGEQRFTNGILEASGLAPGKYIWIPNRNWAIGGVVVNGRDTTGEVLEIGAVNVDVDDVVIAITDRVTTVRGTVGMPDGMPAELASVVILPVDPDRRMMGFANGPMRSVNLGYDGAYAFENLMPGRYYLAAVDEVAMDGWPSTTTVERIAAGADTIVVAEGQTLTRDLRVRR